MASSKSSSGSEALSKMSLEQLKAIKEQADDEVNLLQDSLSNIRNATARLEIASSALNDLSLRPQDNWVLGLKGPHHLGVSVLLRLLSKWIISIKFVGKKMLVPLTASLYVPGTLDDADKVLVDVGTGYFIEKTTNEGKNYCERKINLLKSNFDQLVEVASKKKSIADEATVILQAKLKQLTPST
ncbi:Prefoldin subunit 5 [Quillaja saponaria]|uniref:Prefoldin subunit 5 n=1 Tax=Quillaja saponaria TaxID=32244 RepID=A0AAD7KNA5_QUISA|nr:Prefoldin subunit 5 [Quillaja saponaria]